MITSYKEGELPKVLELVNRVQNHLTAGIVSNDQHFLNEVLGNTINGTIYAGIRARTTGAPQQMWFGPSGDPRSGVGTHRHSGCSPVQYQAAGLFRGYAPCVQGCGPLRPRLQLHATCTCHAHAHAHARARAHVCVLSHQAASTRPRQSSSCGARTARSCTTTAPCPLTTLRRRAERGTVVPVRATRRRGAASSTTSPLWVLYINGS